MSRPTKQAMFMEMAYVAAKRSTCHRAQVGAIITDTEGFQILGMGYNGNARGLTDGCDSNLPGSCGCLHAEENALLKAPHSQPLVLYTTTSPCLHCVKRILNSMVKLVIYDQVYRDTSPLDLFEPHGVQVRQLNYYKESTI